MLKAAAGAAVLVPLIGLVMELALDLPVGKMARNTIMPPVPQAPEPKYNGCNNDTLAADMTIVVTVKDSCSQGPGFVDALTRFAPLNTHLIYTFPNFTSCREVEGMDSALAQWKKVTKIPLPLRSSPMVGWIEAIPHIETEYSMLLHNDGYALDSFFGCELLQSLKTRKGDNFVVAAPMLFESKQDGSLGAHATQSNLRLVKEGDGSVTVHHDHSVRRALNRGTDYAEGEQTDFLEDHGFLIETDKIASVIDPSASYTMEYLDMIFSLKSHAWKVLFVPTARLEFRITEFSWRDVPYFVYKRAESTCHSTRDYMAAKWNANFPNTGFWTFIKYTILEQHQWSIPAEMKWSDQSSVVHGFMQMAGFNRYREKLSSEKSIDFVELLEKIDTGYSSSGTMVASRTTIRTRPSPAEIKPTNITHLEQILPYGSPTREFPFGLEASMPLEYMPFALAELTVASCEKISDSGLQNVCGMVIAHADSCSCWINLPTFKSNGPVARFIYDYMAPLLKMPSRIMTYFEMWMGSSRPASTHVQELRRFESSDFSIFACDGGEHCAAEFAFPKTSKLVSFSGMPATIQDVKGALMQMRGENLSGALDDFSQRCVQFLVVGYVLLQYTYPASRPNPYEAVFKVVAGQWILSMLAQVVGSYSYATLVPAVAALALMCVHRFFMLAISLAGTAPLSLVFALSSQLVPRYTYTTDHEFFAADGCDEALEKKRREAFYALSKAWNKKFTKCIAAAKEMQAHLSDLRFSSGRVFMPFQKMVGEAFEATTVVDKVEGTCLIDLDGNVMQDCSGSYGLNVVGYDRYKQFLNAGNDYAQRIACALGPLNALQIENTRMLAEISQQEEVSLHMSGTEAVMCAVRLARFNSGGRSLVVTFNGAYHGWWDGMQPVAGNERVPGDVSAATIAVNAKGSVAVLTVCRCMHVCVFALTGALP